MKKSIISFLFLFVLSAFSANEVFASNPIPGISIVVRRNQGGIVVNSKTDKNGTFSTKLVEGNYVLTMKYEDILKIINSLEKGKVHKGYKITLEPDTTGPTINGNPPGKLIITKNTGDIIVKVTKGGAKLSFTVTYDSLGQR